MGTGTSWGTFGILIPICIAVFPAAAPLRIISISACMAGRAQRSGVGGGGLVGVVRVGCEIYTADTVQQLRAIVERLEREEATTR